MSVTDRVIAGNTLAGKYVLHRRLGSGGYGSVFEGENRDLGKRVAIKLIAQRHSRSAEAIARFRREARANAKIESANIVQVFDVGEDANAGLYMVMELLRGEDLRRKIDRAGRLSVEFAVDVAHQILAGLAKAHAVGVVHRDLKPANVFLHQPSGEADEDDPRVIAKLVDFGVAKLLDESAFADANPALTTAGKTVGTPQYMSPEQVQGLPFDHRGDLWSVGALLYEMLTGVPAFALRDTFQETALSIVQDTPTPIDRLVPDVPDALIAVVDRALSKDPELRFPDATTFADALMTAVPLSDPHAEARAAEMVSVRPPRPRSLPPPSVPSEPLVVPLDRRAVGMWVAIGVLGLAAAILVVAAFRSSPPREVVAPPPPASTTVVSVAPPDLPLPIVTVDTSVVEPEVSVQAEPETSPIVSTTAAPDTGRVAAPVKPPDQFGGAGVSNKF
jgi:eukaryotic-like serine/threonine-protein kinase